MAAAAATLLSAGCGVASQDSAGTRDSGRSSEATSAPAPRPTAPEADRRPASGPYDLWIDGGAVVDGTGAPARPADLLVRDGRIVFVGPLDQVAERSVEAAEHFDASGLIVAPGFIDAHAHGSPAERPSFPNFLAMGVTTIVLGQDGGGPPSDELAEHLDAIDAARPDVNVVYLVGHHTIRRQSGVGFDVAAPEQRQAMASLVEEGLAAGAAGLSTGLEYDPGSRADAAELAALAAPVAAAGGVVSSHLRSEDPDRVHDALTELIAQGRSSRARVHASHLKIVLEHDPARAKRLVEMLDEARAEGISATADVYPYTASYTGIGILFPDWAKPPADYATVVRTRRDDLAQYLRHRVETRNGPAATRFGSGRLSGRSLAGRTLAEIAELEGRPFEEILIALGPSGASAAYFVVDEAVIRELLRDPWVAVSSDGSPTMQHPRGYGSFARIIRQYVVEEELLTLEEAIRRMTGLTASIFGLDDPDRVVLPRGQIRPGWAADLVAFDPAEVRDVADFDRPHELARGMRAVWVGGTLSVSDGIPRERPASGRTIRFTATPD